MGMQRSLVIKRWSLYDNDTSRDRRGGRPAWAGPRRVPGPGNKKQLLMTRPKQPPVKASPIPPASGKEPGEAFDLWLQRSLHQLFDAVAKEPIPEALLRLIEQSRRS